MQGEGGFDISWHMSTKLKIVETEMTALTYSYLYKKWLTCIYT